jgi:N-methylhydantoinase B/oxoprolinase/acetone carboxylase alpha subunit
MISPFVIVVEDYGLKTVQEYMYHIRNNAENSVRNLLRDVAKRLDTNILSAVDYLDDGSPARAPPKYMVAEVTDLAMEITDLSSSRDQY